MRAGYTLPPSPPTPSGASVHPPICICGVIRPCGGLRASAHICICGVIRPCGGLRAPTHMYMRSHPALRRPPCTRPYVYAESSSLAAASVHPPICICGVIQPCGGLRAPAHMHIRGAAPLPPRLPTASPPGGSSGQMADPGRAPSRPHPPRDSATRTSGPKAVSVAAAPPPALPPLAPASVPCPPPPPPPINPATPTSGPKAVSVVACPTPTAPPTAYICIYDMHARQRRHRRGRPAHKQR